ncbi:MtnX-like HAD-IB family phosphatase [Macrococcus sp. DPC7161]|uniref:MtnX-like HAD-IB family phosphatase n=1 Tax=Macrococcus sp. DPC7161 TaxID=2507060 RepID=UPI00100B5619|nr:MtnX-like HAD-IB family phosphatase [Macrococcus sp. DPC7161]RXK17265.1 2-hydroxy-3-keto-5-methylthiopentenyl-1-phosphate phosphatase [Macrococcus sp. DPC7161]
MGYIIACDFDGTVTSRDTIVSIIKQFAPTEGMPIVERILNKELSIKAGVTQLFALLDSSLQPAIIQYVKASIELRPGFQTLLDEAKRLSIPFYIISGGMHFFIDPVLAQFKGIDGVYANEIDVSHEKMKVIWTHPCDEICKQQACGTCKPSIVRTLGNHQVVAIGDSITDIALANESDILFSTDKLTNYAKEQQIEHYHFETFYDIAKQLESVVIH